jgi:hypothetical protein
MATAVGRFCGRCGAPLAPGATFCGRCGTPVAAAMPLAVAPPPVYRYAPPPPAAGRYRSGGDGKLAPALIAGGLVLVVLVAAVGIGLIAIAQFAASHRGGCTTNCAPKIVTPLPEEESFTSSKYGFVVSYSSAWKVRDQSDEGVVLGTHVGSVQIVGSRGTSAQQAADFAVSGLPTSRWQDVTKIGLLHGPHIGEEQGVGAVYSANLINASQSAIKVRFAVIAATHGDVTVVILAVDPADPKAGANGMPEGQEIDYLCTEFSWG